MDLIKLSHENINNEHICCAISNNSDVQVLSKKAWLSERLDEGLVFLKCNVRGKCFIEYIPAEYAWAPVEAPGYMYINCMWVAGQFKGQGLSNLLMDKCIDDAKQKGKKGLCMLTSKKKTGFLINREYLEHKGFIMSDKAAPYFELMTLDFGTASARPLFKSCIKERQATDDGSGYKIYYTNQCPFTAKYVPLLKAAAKSKGVLFEAVLINTREKAQSAPCPFTTFSLFYNGNFITHEILSEAKFLKLIESNKN